MESKDKSSDEATSESNSSPQCATKHEYFKALQQWVDTYRMQAHTARNMSMMMQYISCTAQMQMYHQQHLWQQQQVAATTSSSAGVASSSVGSQHQGVGLGQGNAQQQRPQAGAVQNNIPHIPVLEFTVPSVYRRVVAELIDFFVLFSAKLSLMLVIIDYMGISDTTGFMMRFLVEEIEDDTSLEELQQMLFFAFIYRVIVCMFETFFLCGHINRGLGGATPGKFMMRLRVISLEQVQTSGPNKVQVTLPDSLGFTQSLLRSVVKNFSMAFFFPACVTVFFNPHFRAAYEVLTRTMVVGTENWPIEAERRR